MRQGVDSVVRFFSRELVMKLIVAVAASAVLLSSAAFASQTKSPIFGASAALPTTADKNKTIVGKGSDADYYGYYGNLYSSYANYYGNSAYGTAGSGYATTYYYAYYYSNLATTNYYDAYYYAYYGY